MSRRKRAALPRSGWPGGIGARQGRVNGMTPGEFITVGKVTASQGNRGEVRIIPLTDFPERFKPSLRLRARKEGEVRTLEVEGARRHGRFVVIKFTGINSISEAERLRGFLLEVAERDLVPLQPGHYYFHEIEGLDVVTTSGRRIGKVMQVVRGTANDIYEVLRDEVQGGRAKTILVPAVRDIVKNIDLERGEITIEFVPGLE
ncbi:MAG: ribosome maturation factor RimM [Bacillota bacterium]